MSRGSFSTFPGRLQYLQLATSCLKFQNATEIADLSAHHIYSQLHDLIDRFCQLSPTIVNRLNANMLVNDSE